MKDSKKKEKNKKKQREHDAERRKFIEKSAKDIGACGYAFYELARTIKSEIMQEVVEDIKKAIRKP